jgi:hypothetical protein
VIIQSNATGVDVRYGELRIMLGSRDLKVAIDDDCVKRGARKSE